MHHPRVEYTQTTGSMDTGTFPLPIRAMQSPRRRVPPRRPYPHAYSQASCNQTPYLHPDDRTRIGRRVHLANFTSIWEFQTRSSSALTYTLATKSLKPFRGILIASTSIRSWFVRLIRFISRIIPWLMGSSRNRFVINQLFISRSVSQSSTFSYRYLFEVFLSWARHVVLKIRISHWIEPELQVSTWANSIVPETPWLAKSISRADEMENIFSSTTHVQITHFFTYLHSSFQTVP